MDEGVCENTGEQNIEKPTDGVELALPKGDHRAKHDAFRKACILAPMDILLIPDDAFIAAEGLLIHTRSANPSLSQSRDVYFSRSFST